jgi:hypothetical protein
MQPTLHHLQRLDAYGAWRSFTEQYLASTGVFKDYVISIMATYRQAREHWRLRARQGRTGQSQARRCAIRKAASFGCESQWNDAVETPAREQMTVSRLRVFLVTSSFAAQLPHHV